MDNSTPSTATQAVLHGRVAALGWVSPSPPPLSLYWSHSSSSISLNIASLSFKNVLSVHKKLPPTGRLLGISGIEGSYKTTPAFKCAKHFNLTESSSASFCPCVPTGHIDNSTSAFPNPWQASSQGVLPISYDKLAGVSALELPGWIHIPTLSQCLTKLHTLYHLNFSSAPPSGPLGSNERPPILSLLLRHWTGIDTSFWETQGTYRMVTSIQLSQV